MEMNDIIRKAVELAEGWSYQNDAHSDAIIVETLDGYTGVIPGSVEFSDALAAQLVRQVDALDKTQWSIEVLRGYTRVTECDMYGLPKEEWYGRGPARTMNTIKAIVESGVLEGEK